MFRGALLTPWAAVSLGIVMAASLTLATPSAVLTFPPGRPARCQSVACGPAGGGQDRGSLPTAGTGVRLEPVRTGPSSGVASHHATLTSPGQVRVQYALMRKYGRHFVAEIVITGKQALGDWTLRFRIPGSQIKLVMWAKWKPAGLDGGFVSGSPGQPGSSGANRARIIIMGTGSPGRPAACIFDGVRCTFRDFSGGVSHFNWRSVNEDGG